MPKATKRERQRQNREARRAAQLEIEKRQKRKRTIRNLVFLLVPLVIVFAVIQLTNSDDSDSKSAAATKNGCSTKVPPKPTTTTLSAPPAFSIDPSVQYTAVMKTSCGDITIALDAASAPQTVNSFIALAKSGFYNGTYFHRIVTDFVDQGGDPTGTGSGGPGYQLPDEPPANGYQAGSVAMANAGSGTTGSQFFLVVSDTGAQTLGTAPPYKYSALGTMDAAGLKVAKKINSFGSKSEAGTPTQKVYVTSVEISEAPSTTTTAPTTTAAP